MGRHQKDRIITSLQFQRDEDICSVLKRFNDRDIVMKEGTIGMMTVTEEIGKK